LIADYHVHTPYCGHAHGAILEYIRSAITLGLKEIGFADHLGRYYLTKTQKRRYWDWGMDERGVSKYVAELLDLRDMLADQITIRIGLEVDYVEGAEELVEPILKQFPLDFCLCSVHCLPRFSWKHIANYKEQNVIQLYQEYFSVVRAAMHCGLFHSLAHLDFIWRYLAWPENDGAAIFDEIAATVKTASEMGCRMEINANGYLWSQNKIVDSKDPFDVFIRTLSQRNVPITLGSDAHEPKMVGKAFPKIIDYLHRRGVTTFTRFTKGKAIIESLG